MSNPEAKSVSWFSVAGVFIGLGLFAVLVHYFYKPRAATLPYNVAAESLPADQAWQATPEGRKKHLEEIRKAEAAKANAYGWVDKEKGVVQLPIDRAMELTLKDISANKR